MAVRRTSAPLKERVPLAKDPSTTRTSRRYDWAIMLTYACVVLAAILATARIGLLSWQRERIIINDTYQVVALDNGQTFFGRLSHFAGNAYVLVDVYYLRNATVDANSTATEADTTTDTETSDVATTTDNPELELVALTSDVHKPYNHIIINPEHMLYWQNLQPDSPIIAAIAQDKADKANN